MRREYSLLSTTQREGGAGAPRIERDEVIMGERGMTAETSKRKRH